MLNPSYDMDIKTSRNQAKKIKDKWCMGWGACSVSGCPCQGFKQTYGSELCENCGHKYSDHW